MDAAFSAIVLLALVVPGAAFTYAYGRRVAVERGITLSLSNVTGKTFFAIIYSVPLNALWVLIANWHLRGTGSQVDIRTVVYLASGHFDDAKDFDAAIAEVGSCIGSISIYFVSLYLCSALLGMFCFWVVRRRRWDLRWSALRFPGDWGYITRGELDALPLFNIGSSGALAAVAVELAGEAYVYIGALVGTIPTDNGKIDKLIIKYAERHLLAEFIDGKSKPGSHRLDAEIVVIPEREIKNIAFSYIGASRGDQGNPSPKPARGDRKESK